MLRKLIFRDTVTQKEYMMPVTPAKVGASSGVSLEVINISELGDVALPGTPTLASLSVDLLLPAQDYSFCVVTPLEPYTYIQIFKDWALDGTVVRYIISGTSVNIPVLVESVDYEENDGTNDVTATLRMRQYKALSAPVIANVAEVAEAEPERESEEIDATEQTYTAVWGDTLSSIARKFYGKASYYPKLAAYNGKPNPNILMTGEVLEIPPIDILEATEGVAYSKYSRTGYGFQPPGGYKPTGMPTVYSDRQIANVEAKINAR